MDVANATSPTRGWNLRSHNPEVAGSNPAPATGKAPETGLFCSLIMIRRRNFCQLLPLRVGSGPSDLSSVRNEPSMPRLGRELARPDETDHARRVQVGKSQAQAAIACAR